MFSTAVRQARVCLGVVPNGCDGARNMATLKELRIRITSVKSITKLTKTMQMIANNKMRSAQRKSDAALPFVTGPLDVLKEVTPDRDHGTNLLVTCTTDKGMCGSINTQMLKYVKGVMRSNPIAFNLIFAGAKGAGSIAKEFPGQFVFSVKELGRRDFTYLETSFAVEQMILTNTNYNTVTVLYNKFKNAVTYIPTEDVVPGPGLLNENLNKFSLYEFEEVESTTFRDLFEFQVLSSVWNGIFQNRSSELAARMTSMDNATKNAGAISAALSVAYNRGRQSAITTELVEICSGAAAISG